MKFRELLTEIDHVLEDDISGKQMALIIIFWMLGLAVFGIVAFIIIHVMMGY